VRGVGEEYLKKKIYTNKNWVFCW